MADDEQDEEHGEQDEQDEQGEEEWLGGNGPPSGPSVGDSVAIPYLRAWRAVRGLTRAQLCARTAAGSEKPLTENTVLSIERKGRPARLSTAIRLARALGISVDELLHTDPFKLPPA